MLDSLQRDERSTDGSAYEAITLEMIDDVAKITLNRPERLNACSSRMAAEVFDALDAVEGRARALLLTGAGRAFCSGADLQGSADESVARGDYVFRSLSRFHNPMIHRLLWMPIPVISAVNGAAAGIGCSIALAADFVIAARSAYFLQAFVNVGLVPDGGASWLLPRLVGKARATEMMMLGEPVAADRAEAWGMIHKCVDDAALPGEAEALARRLAAGPTVALGIMRRNLLRAMDCDLSTAFSAEADGQRRAGDTADSSEGIAAFREKRKARFEGR